MNEFIHVNSAGGYFGAFAWCNSDMTQRPNSSTDKTMFGRWISLSNRNITGLSWAGSLWAVRHML